MTADEFQRQYHYYVASTQAEAEAEAVQVNQVLESSAHGTVTAVEFPSLGWALMLSGPHEFIRDFIR